MIDLSVVVPVYDEEGNLPPLVTRVLGELDRIGVTSELVLVDDGSTDASPRLIAAAAREHPGRVIAVLKPSNAGQHAAILSGFAAAHGRQFVTLDADLQNPPEEIGRVFAELEKGADVVGTVRRDRQDTFFRRFASASVNLFVRLSCHGALMHDYGCMLRGYSRQIVERLLADPAHARFIPVRAMVFAGHPVEIEVAHTERTSGESKYGLLKLVRLFSDLVITVFFRGSFEVIEKPSSCPVISPERSELRSRRYASYPPSEASCEAGAMRGAPSPTDAESAKGVCLRRRGRRRDEVLQLPQRKD